MFPATEQQSSVLPIEAIRSESVFSRLPLHQLAKKSDTNIKILRRDSVTGKIVLRWEVSYNATHGAPRQLGFRIDKLVVNRRIEELKKPLVSRFVRLGSLREIAQELNLGGNTNKAKKALIQNSATYITCNIVYKDKEGIEHTIEEDFTRYNIRFWRQKLEDGTEADAVYLRLNDPFFEIVNKSVTRPLDYAYLKQLPAGPSRFYELLSYRFFPAIKYGHNEASLQYSWYCEQAPQIRYKDRRHTQIQMAKIHRAHLKSGYISNVRWKKTRDEQGRPDWFIHYTPGPKAVAEFEQFAGRRIKRQPLKVVEIEPRPTPRAGESKPAPKVHEDLLSRLTDPGRGVSESVARKLLANATPAQEEHIADCIDCWDSIPNMKQAGLLIGFIRKEHTLPTNFVNRAQRREIDAKNRAQRDAQGEQERLEQAHEAYIKREIDRQIASAPAEYDRLIQEAKQKQVELAQRDHPHMTDKEDWAARMATYQARGQIVKRLSLMDFNTFCAQQKQANATQEGTITNEDPPASENSTVSQPV